jgi:hypothetical protein
LKTAFEWRRRVRSILSRLGNIGYKTEPRLKRAGSLRVPASLLSSGAP